MFVFLLVMYKLELMAVCQIITRHTHNHNYLNYHMHRAVGACKRSQCGLLVQMMFTVPEEVPVRRYLSHELLLLWLLSYKPITRVAPQKSYFTVQRKKDVYFQTADFFYECCQHNMNMILFCIALKKKYSILLSNPFLCKRTMSKTLKKKHFNQCSISSTI